MESETATELESVVSEATVDDFDEEEGEYWLPDEPELDPTREIIHIIPRNERRTSEVLDPAGEMASVLITRIQEIERGGVAFVDTKGCKNATEIAKRELLEKKTPLKVRRIVYEEGNEKWVEEWSIDEMTIPSRELKLDLGLL